MSVLFITPRYYPFTGGVERVVKSIAERMKDSAVFCGNPNIERTMKRSINKVVVFDWPIWSPSNSYHIPRKTRALEDFLKKILTDFDVIHVHNAHAVFSVYTGLKVKKIDRDKKVIFSPYYHGKGHTKLANLLWKITFKYFVKKLLDESSTIIVNSKFQKNILINKFGCYKNVEIVYDGIDIEGIRASKPLDELKKDDGKIILCVSRLEPYKNVHLSIKALQYLPRSFKLVIVGKGSDEYTRYLLKLAHNEGLAKRVQFLGYQPDEVVWSLYKTADVFLHLSEVESFGMTCLEALATGTPVIVNNDEAGLKETAELFPEYIKVYNKNDMSLKQLAKMIEEVSNLKPLKVDLSVFSWDSIVKRLKEIYSI